MNGKDYSEGSLSRMIDVAHQYIDSVGIRDSIIGKCHLELGLIVAGAPIGQRKGITLTPQEATAMRKAILQWHKETKQSGEKPA